MASSSSSMSHFATSLIALLMFQVTFNPFLASNAQGFPGLNIPQILTPIVRNVPQILTPIVGSVPQILTPIVGSVPQILTPIGSVLGGTLLGVLCCNTTQTSCPGSGIPNVTVSLTCMNLLGVSTVVGTGVTNATGSFNITVGNLVQGILPGLGGLPTSGLLPCMVSAPVPLDSAACLLGNTGSAATRLVTSAVRIVGTVSNGLFGILRLLSIAGFVEVGI